LSDRGSLPKRQWMIRLVLIEDHQALRQGLELLLAQEGCHVVGTAGTVEEGHSLVVATEPDVIVIDVGLGEGESGIDLTRRLLAARAERRIVLYTGSSGVDQLLDGLDSGAVGYALKEGPSHELMEAIEAVAAGGTYVDPRLRASLMSYEATRRQPTLTLREREIIQMLADGLTGEEVADRLVLSAETIKTHIRNAMTKLEARNRVHAIAIALRAGEITLGAAGAVAR
jgi:DNA-binding NarL/FixJ family response regulator